MCPSLLLRLLVDVIQQYRHTEGEFEMAVSVRMDPLPARELEAAAKRLGKTRSQFIIDVVERSLGRKSPCSLMQVLIAEEEAGTHGPLPPADSLSGRPYDTDASKQALSATLRAKHGVGRVVDASVIVATFGQRQSHGAHYRALLRKAEVEGWSLFTPWPCIVEAWHLLDVLGRSSVITRATPVSQRRDSCRYRLSDGPTFEIL